MTVEGKTTVKTFFQRGDRPTSAQFADLIDSYLNYSSGLDDFNDRLITTSGGVTHYTENSFRIQSEGVSAAAHSSPSFVLLSRDQETPDGAGPFLRFESYSKSGAAVDAVQLNGGLVDASAGLEQGDLDITVYRDGASTVAAAIRGDWQALAPGQNNQWKLGTTARRWSNIYAASAMNVTQANSGAAAGPFVTLVRDSDTPASSDAIGAIFFRGKDNAGNVTDYARLQGDIIDHVNTSEDGQLRIQVAKGGTLTTELSLGSGAAFGSPTGGYQGSGTINAESLYSNGVEVTAASTAQAAAGTNTQQYMTPDNFRHHSLAIRGYANFTSAAAVQEAQRVSSVSHVSGGNFVIKWSKAMPTANYAIGAVGGIADTAGWSTPAVVVSALSPAVSAVHLRFAAPTTNTPTDPNNNICVWAICSGE